MLGRGKGSRTLGEHAIFGDEEAAQLRAEVIELREAMADLNARVHSQFTTIAAHAEIARQQADFAREEGRADLERTRDTLIDLVEQVRGETALHAAGSAPGASSEMDRERLVRIERRLDMLAGAIDESFSQQRQLADTMAALLDTVLAEQRGEPVAGLSLA